MKFKADKVSAREKSGARQKFSQKQMTWNFVQRHRAWPASSFGGMSCCKVRVRFDQWWRTCSTSVLDIFHKRSAMTLKPTQFFGFNRVLVRLNKRGEKCGSTWISKSSYMPFSLPIYDLRSILNVSPYSLSINNE